VVKDTSMCGLGQSAPNPVLSTLRYFRDEYKRHIYDRRWRCLRLQRNCRRAMRFGCPIGTEAWRYIAHIQRGEFEDAYRVIRRQTRFHPYVHACAITRARTGAPRVHTAVRQSQFAH